MENTANISSEQELLQLRDEGKISEDEYEQLLATMRKSSAIDAERILRKETKSKQKRKVGIAAFIWMLGGIIFPALAMVASNISINEPSFLLFAVGWEIFALTLSIIAWPDAFGKASAIASSFILIVLIIFIGFTMPRAVPVSNEAPQPTHSMTTGAVELKRFPLDKMDGIITQSGVQFDKQISSDGNGSLRIEATQSTTIRLFETGDIDIENARLIYQAKVRTENVKGQIYLEMWCHFPGLGESFSRGLATPLSGSTEWTTEETPFFLEAGENPDNVKLNLVINGKGTAWIDDIRLLKGPLKY